MPPTLLRTALRDFTRRPWQSGLMILGIALGVAVVIAIDLANTSASRAFTLSTEAVTGRATHQIVGGPEGLPDELYRQVRVEWGYRLSTPMVEGLARAPELDAQPLRILGVDALAEPPFRSYLTQAALNAQRLDRFYTMPNAVIIGAGLAEQYQLALDDAIQLQIGAEFKDVIVVGILTPQDASNRRALDGILLMDVGAAQTLLNLPRRLTRIDLILTAAEAEALSARLPASARLTPASAQANTVAQLTSAFQLNLTALSLLALVVGMFLIYNTVMFNVVQRRAVFGMLRSLGVTGEQLFALILLEAALVAGIGSVLGLGLGWLLGQGAVRLVTQTINDLYYVVSVRDAPLTLFSALKGVGLGIGAGLAAALAPALEAANVEPITIMRRSTLEDRVRAWLPKIALAGTGLVGAGVLALLAISNSLIASFSGLFAIVIGLALMVPTATIVFMRLATPVLDKTIGALGRMAARTVVKAISRTSVAIAALMVAVSVTIGVSVMIASFRATVVNWLDLTLVADIYISAPTVGGTRANVTLDADLPERLAHVPGVAAIETIRTVMLESNVGPVQVSVSDSQKRRSASLFRFASGDPGEMWEQVQNGAVMVSEPFAFRHHLPPQGGTITLHTDTGEHTFPVVGIYYDYASDQGTVVMSRAVYNQYWADRTLSGVSAYITPEADINKVAEALRAELAGTALQVQVNRALREQALVIFDRTFAITNALRILAVIVAFIGVLSALMALQIERARELATLQALGLTPAQLWQLTFLETGLMGATAGLLSLPTGYVLALVLVYVINLRSFGWSIQMLNEPWVYGQALGVSVLAALLAAIYPMRRLLKMEVAAALRQE